MEVTIMFNLGFIIMAAIVVGIGFTVGKYFGDFIVGIIDALIINMLKRTAYNGNVISQEMLRKRRIQIDAKDTDVVKNKIGF